MSSKFEANNTGEVFTILEQRPIGDACGGYNFIILTDILTR